MLNLFTACYAVCLSSMKIRMWTVLLETSQNVDHCQYHLGIDHCQKGNRCQDGNEHADYQDQWSAQKYNECINLIRYSYHDHITMFNYNTCS